jgi:hypothetical protein
MCKGSSGGQNSTVTSTTSPPPQILSAYQNLINQGTAVSQLPLQQYQGPTIAGFNPTQQAAFSEVNQAQGAALPYINAAQQYLSAGADNPFSQVMTWSPSNLSQFEDPYTQQVTQATQNLLNQQNAEQFNQANAAAASSGAFGGDREAVLQSQMAQQQQLAEAPTLAGLQSQGFTTAAGLLGQQQNLQLQGLEGNSWLAENAAAQESGLGNEAQNSLLSGASSELQTGGLEQQLQQEELNVPEEQFLQQQAFPYQTTDFLAGLVEGAAPGEGGTSTTTSPGPSLVGQIAGLGLTGLGLANQYGLFGSGNSLAGTGLSSAGFLPGDAGLADLGYTPASALAGGLTAVRRGGRARPPTLRRDIGGFVPIMPGLGDSASTALTAGLSASDTADVNQAIALSGASPVAMPPPGGHPLPMATPNVVSSGAGAGTSGSSGASSLMSLLPVAAEAAMMFMRRGGSAAARLVPSRDHAGFPRAFAAGGDGGDDTDVGQHSFDLSDPLIRIGAAMMASKSPYVLSQLGEGLQAGLNAARSAAPRVDESGPRFRLVYSGGHSWDSSLPNINSPPTAPQESPS